MNNEYLKVTSFNCNSFKSSIDAVQMLCKDNDILLLQETWLLENEIGMLNNVDDQFYGKGISSVDLSGAFLMGRPFGGLAFLYKKRLSPHVKIVDYADKRIFGLEVTSGSLKMLIVNVYFPYECHNNFYEYVDYLGKMYSIIDTTDTPYVIVLGDMNADTYMYLDPGSGYDSVFGKEMLKFCDEHNLIISDLDRLGCSDKVFTHYSDAHNTVSWLDHCIATVNAHKLITDVSIIGKFVVSDHFPLSIRVEWEVKYTATRSTKRTENRKINWSELSVFDQSKYKESSEVLLQNIYIPVDVIECKNANCNLPTHKNEIDSMYRHINQCLHEAGDTLKVVKIKKPYKIIPGWNDVCRDAHLQARESFLIWVSYGKPKVGIIFTCMTRSRALFKYSLRYCKRAEKTIVADKLATELYRKNYINFWKQVKIMNAKHTPVANMIGGCQGSQDIAKMWKNHFSSLLNNASSRASYRNQVINSLKNCVNIDGISDHVILEALRSLKSGVSPGPDGITTEHFKHAGPKLSVLLSLLFSSIFTHGYLPASIMATTIVPLLKDKTGDIADVNNYRPIAMATVTSKLLEYVIQMRYDEYLMTSDNQFSFKKSHSTDMAVFSLKETVNLYRAHSSPVFICFLDSSKAFDKINHWALFAKLIARNVPLFVVRLLLYWYRNQTLSVLWDGVRSDSFKTSNGVKQGGVLSPLLFNIYMDDLSILLNQSGIGCHVNDSIINHVMYADDMCLLAPCSTALQKLVNICYDYANEHDILYNAKKSVCMLINSKKFHVRSYPSIRVGSCTLGYVKSCKYLGCLIDEQLCDNDDIQKTLRGIYARGNVLIRRFSNCSQKVKLMLFQSFCTNFYCTHLWWSYSRETLRNTTVAYNNTLRFMMGYGRFCSASGMFVQCNIDNFETIRRRYIYGFKCRLQDSKNYIVKCLLQHQLYEATPSAMEWGRSLYTGQIATIFL